MTTKHDRILGSLAKRFRDPQAYDRLVEISGSLETAELAMEVKEAHLRSLCDIALSYKSDSYKALGILSRVYMMALREVDSPFKCKEGEIANPLLDLEESFAAVNGDGNGVPVGHLGTFTDRIFHGFSFDQYNTETDIRDKRIEKKWRNQTDIE